MDVFIIGIYLYIERNIKFNFVIWYEDKNKVIVFLRFNDEIKKIFKYSGKVIFFYLGRDIEIEVIGFWKIDSMGDIKLVI